LTVELRAEKPCLEEVEIQVIQQLPKGSQQLWQGKEDDKTTSLCAAEEDTGSEEAGRPLATLPQTPRNPKQLQRR